MILDRPNCFGRIQIILVGSKSFWLGPNHFGQVQIRFLQFGPVQNDLNQTNTNWARPKRLVLDIEGQGIRQLLFLFFLSVV